MSRAADLEVSAPAKINLWLRVLRRREDGFHELETRMATVSLADQMRFWRDESCEGVELACPGSDLPVNDDNLVMRAAKLMEERSGQSFSGLRIELDKRIPHGAGLGGGSSDAAATFKALRDLYGLPLEDQELVAMAAQLGSDIPFFLSGGACDCSGRGERVQSVSDFEGQGQRVLLVKPDFSVATPWAYRQWKDSRELTGVNYGPQEHRLGSLVNDLERPVFEKFSVLADMKQLLGGWSGVEAALMSGSGSTLFALLSSEAETEALEIRLREEYGDTTFVWVGELTG